jgi:hypothetical protein
MLHPKTTLPPALLLASALAAKSLTAAVVYDNTSKPLSRSFNPGVEFGDEVVLGSPYGSVRSSTITSIAFDYVGQNFHGDEKVRVRFYLNDGPVGSAGAKKPGTVIYDSGFFAITASATGTTAKRENLAVTNVPGSFTWTVEFLGVTAPETAGLKVYSPPVIGKNYDDYWERSGTDWKLKYSTTGPMSFGALILAAEVFPAEDLRVIIQILPLAQGKRPLRVTGPAGRTYAVEASDDLKAWRPITTFTSSNSTTTCFDAESPTHPHRFYRVWKPYPDSLPQVRLSAQAVSPGSLRLAVQGQPGRIYVVEESNDLLGWSSFTNIQSTVSESSFLELRSGEWRFFRVKQ